MLRHEQCFLHHGGRLSVRVARASWLPLNLTLTLTLTLTRTLTLTLTLTPALTPTPTLYP